MASLYQSSLGQRGRERAWLWGQTAPGSNPINYWLWAASEPLQMGPTLPPHSDLRRLTRVLCERVVSGMWRRRVNVTVSTQPRWELPGAGTKALTSLERVPFKEP